MKPIQSTKEQDAAVARKFADGSHPFSTCTLEDYQLLEAYKWFAGREVEGLVDTSCGGIVGYVHNRHADRIAAMLNVATLGNPEISREKT